MGLIAVALPAGKEGMVALIAVEIGAEGVLTGEDEAVLVETAKVVWAAEDDFGANCEAWIGEGVDEDLTRELTAAMGDEAAELDLAATDDAAADETAAAEERATLLLLPDVE